jgi:hypothetical protein
MINYLQFSTTRSRIFHLYGDVTIVGEGLQNLGLCSALRAFEQRGIFIVSHLRPVQQSEHSPLVRVCSPLNGSVRYSLEASACEQSRAFALLNRPLL